VKQAADASIHNTPRMFPESVTREAVMGAALVRAAAGGVKL